MGLNTFEEKTEIKAITKTTFDIIETSEEYMKMAIVHVLFMIGSVLIFIFLTPSPLVIAMAVISLLCAIYMFYNNKALDGKIGKLDDCYIRLTDNNKFIECKQLVNGKYEYMKLSIADIKETMEVLDGIQIWLKDGSENFLFLVNDKQVEKTRTIFCINHFAYDLEEFISWNVCLSAVLPDDVIIRRNNQPWKKPTKKEDTKKMMFPALLYLIPLIISVVLTLV